MALYYERPINHHFFYYKGSRDCFDINVCFLLELRPLLSTFLLSASLYQQHKPAPFFFRQRALDRMDFGQGAGERSSKKSKTSTSHSNNDVHADILADLEASFKANQEQSA